MDPVFDWPVGQIQQSYWSSKNSLPFFCFSHVFQKERLSGQYFRCYCSSDFVQLAFIDTGCFMFNCLFDKQTLLIFRANPPYPS